MISPKNMSRFVNSNHMDSLGRQLTQRPRDATTSMPDKVKIWKQMRVFYLSKVWLKPTLKKRRIYWFHQKIQGSLNLLEVRNTHGMVLVSTYQQDPPFIVNGTINIRKQYVEQVTVEFIQLLTTLQLRNQISWTQSWAWATQWMHLHLLLQAHKMTCWICLNHKNQHWVLKSRKLGICSRNTTRTETITFLGKSGCAMSEINLQADSREDNSASFERNITELLVQTKRLKNLSYLNNLCLFEKAWKPRI